MDGFKIASGLVWFVAFLFSTTFHEAAHAFFAWRGGDPTAHQGGQVSLSPFPHMRREPLGMLIVPLMSALTQGWAIGWASTPYDPRWATRFPRRAAMMSAAGPAANFLLALIAFTLLKLGVAGGWFGTGDVLFRDLLSGNKDGRYEGYPEQILLVVLFLNVLLFVFNLIPVPPLDGGTAIGLFLPEGAAKRLRDLRQTPYLSMIGFAIAYFGFPYVVGPIIGFVNALLQA